MVINFLKKIDLVTWLLLWRNYDEKPIFGIFPVTLLVTDLPSIINFSQFESCEKTTYVLPFRNWEQNAKIQTGWTLIELLLLVLFGHFWQIFRYGLLDKTPGQLPPD